MQFTPESRLHVPKIKDYLQTLEIDIQDVLDEDLLLTACIHKSYAADYIGDYAHNERLEFLGDGILGAIVNKMLFLQFKTEPESKLTLYKIKLVREETLADIARDIELDKIILLGNGEERQGGRQKNSVLSDCLEALIGYLYLDQPLSVVEKFIEKYVYTKLPEVKEKDFKSFKSLIQEYVQKQTKELPVYETKEYSKGEDAKEILYESVVHIGNRPQGTGIAKNKKAAEEAAAKEAYNKLVH